MHIGKWFRATFAAAIMLGLVAPVAMAQNNAADPPKQAEARTWFKEYLRYFKLDANASPQDVEQMIRLKVKAEAPSSTLADRPSAYKELFTLLLRLAGNTSITEQQINAGAQNYAMAAERLATGKGASAIGNATTPLGQFGHVEVKGRGPVPMILFADIRADWTLYQSFMERNADRYTMYAVTLPGFGGSPPPPRPDTFDLTPTPWWKGLEQASIALIEKHKLSKPVLVGTNASAYLVTRLALDYPNKCRAAVLLNGLVYMIMTSPANPTKPATFAERQNAGKQPVTAGLLQELLPLSRPTREFLEEQFKTIPIARNPVAVNARDPERIQTLFVNFGLGADPRAYRYVSELSTTDLTADFKNLAVPTLMISAVHDDDSPYQGRAAMTQWEEIKLRYPDIPLSLLPFEDTRGYIVIDAPQELDRAIAAFLPGKPLEGKHRKIVGARPSPRASVMQAIGATEVTLAYSRPALKDRKISGEGLGPSQVWRTGANEATTISLTSDVMVEGQKLPAGTYSLFSIPGDSEWTIIFNKVPDQWGAFSYNAAFDALRIQVKPQDAAHQEWLSFGFDMLSQHSAQAFLHFGKVKVPFKIEAMLAP